MRVAVDATPLFGAPTGVAQSLQGLLGALPRAAPDVEVVPYVLSSRARRSGAVDVGGRPAIAPPLPAAIAIRAWGRADRPRLDRWLGTVDVVHGSNFVVPPVTLPTTATIHDCWCARHPETCSPSIAAFTRAVRRAVRRGAWLHVTTRHGAEEVAEVYGATERVVVVPFAVPTAAGPAAPRAALPTVLEGRPYVLALGALDPRKGLAVLVEAFAPVAAGRPDLHLVLAGPNGPARPAVDEAVGALAPPVRERVHLLGTVDDGTRVALLEAAAVLAYPSLDEGFGFPVLEAMAAGVPVVASTAGALPEVAGDAAELVPVGDLDALAAGLELVLTDAARRADLVVRGRSRAATFTWERTATGMAELWRRAVAAGP